MPWVNGPLCSLCNDRVIPVRGDLRACRCGKTITGIRPDGSLHVTAPEFTELVPICVSMQQLELPLAPPMAIGCVYEPGARR